MRKLGFIVEKRCGLRVALSEFGITSERARTLLKNRDVRVNGSKCGEPVDLNVGDEITIYLPDDYPEVLHEARGMLAVLKPQGVAVTGRGDTLENRVRHKCPTARACHRLDVNTGGIVLFALDKANEDAILYAIKRREIKKHYRCIAVGTPKLREAELRAFMIKDERRATVRVLDKPEDGALHIVTRYSTLCAGPMLALLDVELVTGRTHQIRAHLSHIGHPILGDDKYGDREVNRIYGKRRQQLFAYRIELPGGKVIDAEPPFSEKDVL